MRDKQADLAGPGIGTCEELERLLPDELREICSARDIRMLD